MKRTRPFALIAVLAAGALVAVLTGAAKPLPAGQFSTTGHWVFNSALQMVFHIDGATTNIDANAPVPGEPGSQVVQGDTNAYVVGQNGITEFDRSTLSVQQTVDPPVKEIPVGIEVVGGPYLVYRNAGTVVRLGDPMTTVSVGGAVGTPVVTADGTMWLHRQDSGQICTLGKDADRIAGCPVAAPPGHAGAMTIVDGRPAFIDTVAATLHVVDGDKLGAGVPLGVPISPNARPATQDLAGRVAILDPQRQSLLLADTRNPPGKPISVALPAGDYDGPVSTGDVVALVDKQSGTVLTFGPDGVRKDSKPLREKAGQPRLSRGEDKRVYVEDADGSQVLVVAKDGSVRDVSVVERPNSSPPVPVPTPSTETPRDVVAAPPPGQRQQPQRHQQGPQGQQQGPPSRRQDPTGQRSSIPPKSPPPVPASRPGAPASVSAVAGNGSATVSWGAAPDNRAPVTSYQVSWRGGGGQTGSTTVGGGSRRTTVTGLTNGVRYVFTVTATNRVGTGPGASANPVTPSSPVSPAGKPVNLQAVYDVDDRPTRDVKLTWRQPALNGGTLVHYEITGSLGTDTVTGTQITYPQLEASRVYRFTVRAVTRTSDGKTLKGQPATIEVRDAQ